MIRNFEPADQDAVRRLVLSGLRDRWGHAYDPFANPDLDDIGGTYVGHGAQVVVLEQEGSILACGILLRETEDRGRIVRVSVHTEHRRRGFGRRIVGHLVDRARQLGLKEVAATTDSPWTSAVRLYLSCGFTEVARDDSDTHLVKELGPAA